VASGARVSGERPCGSTTRYPGFPVRRKFGAEVKLWDSRKRDTPRGVEGSVTCGGGDAGEREFRFADGATFRREIIFYIIHIISTKIFTPLAILLGTSDPIPVALPHARAAIPATSAWTAFACSTP
jgi:hypothetical protein